MSFQEPVALAFLLAVPILILLHLLRSRYERVYVSSLLLWKKLPRDVQAYASWRKLRWDWLLMVQILVVSAAALALARPNFASPEGRHLALVLDASPSMAAHEAGTSRFELAKQQASELVQNARDTDVVSLVVASERPSVPANAASRREALAALQDLVVGAEAADMPSALNLAASMVASRPGARGEVVVLTDGSFDVDLPALPAATRFLSIGADASDWGIVEASLREPLGGSTRLSGFARLVNFTDGPRQVELSVHADGLQVDTRSATLPPRGRAEVAFQVPAGSQLVRLSIPKQDDFALNDTVVLQAPASRARSVMVVSDSPSVWERVLTAQPNVTVRSIGLASYRTVSADVLLLLDSFLPADLPPNDMIVVNPPPQRRLLRAVGIEGRSLSRVAEFDRNDPLLKGVDLGPVLIQRATTVVLPPWATSAADSELGPLILHGRRDGRKLVIFTFDPRQSNLPQLAAFPVLMSNVVNFLTPGRADEVRVGLGPETDVRVRSHETIRPVTDPSGTLVPGRDLWAGLALLGLALVGAEWWLYARRT